MSRPCLIMDVGIEMRPEMCLLTRCCTISCSDQCGQHTVHINEWGDIL